MSHSNVKPAVRTFSEALGHYVANTRPDESARMELARRLTSWPAFNVFAFEVAHWERDNGRSIFADNGAAANAG